MELDSWASDSSDSDDSDEDSDEQTPFAESCPIRTVIQTLLYHNRFSGHNHPVTPQLHTMTPSLYEAIFTTT